MRYSLEVSRSSERSAEFLKFVQHDERRIPSGRGYCRGYSLIKLQLPIAKLLNVNRFSIWFSSLRLHHRIQKNRPVDGFFSSAPTRRREPNPRDEGRSRGFEPHAASLRSGLRLQAQDSPILLTRGKSPGRFLAVRLYHRLRKATLGGLFMSAQIARKRLLFVIGYLPRGRPCPPPGRRH